MIDEYAFGDGFKAGSATAGESFVGVKDVDVLVTALRCRLLLRLHRDEVSRDQHSREHQPFRPAPPAPPLPTRPAPARTPNPHPNLRES